MIATGKDLNFKASRTSARCLPDYSMAILNQQPDGRTANRLPQGDASLQQQQVA